MRFERYRLLLSRCKKKMQLINIRKPVIHTVVYACDRGSSIQGDEEILHGFILPSVHGTDREFIRKGIKNLVTNCEWDDVRTDANPDDPASRGMFPRDLRFYHNLSRNQKPKST